MRDLVMLGFMLAVLPFALRSSYAAYLLWGWAGLVGIINYMYGFMVGVAYAQMFAIITLVTFLINRQKESASFKSNTTNTLLLLFAFQAIITMTFAYDDLARNSETGTDILKTILFCFLMPMLVTSRFRLHALIIMMALGLGFHSMLDGLKFLSSGGAHISRGIAKFGDNNHTAVAFAIVIPILLYAARYSVNKWVKLGFTGVMVLTVLAIIATRSRGGFATLLVIAVWMMWHTKRKAAGMALLFACAGVALYFAPPEWTDRMDTIQAAEQDNSFMTRVAAWKKSTAIALAHPLEGGGFYAVQAPVLNEKYKDAQGLLGFIVTPNPYNYAAHSIYFQVMSDTGFIGFFIYLALFANAFGVRRKIHKFDKLNGNKDQWAVDLSNTISYSMIAFLAGGSLVSVAYFDIPFILIAIMQVIWFIISNKPNIKLPI